MHPLGKMCDVISVFSLTEVCHSLQLRMLGTTAFPAELTSVRTFGIFLIKEVKIHYI